MNKIDEAIELIGGHLEIESHRIDEFERTNGFTPSYSKGLSDAYHISLRILRELNETAESDGLSQSE